MPHPIAIAAKALPWRWIGTVVLACVAGALLWWLLIGRADKAAQQAAEAKAGRVVAEQRGAAAVDAGKVIERHYQTTREIERIRDAGLANVRAADTDRAAGDAARCAIRMLDPAGYGADPACQLP